MYYSIWNASSFKHLSKRLIKRMFYRLKQKLHLPWEGFHLKAGFQIQVNSALKVHLNLFSANKRLMVNWNIKVAADPKKSSPNPKCYPLSIVLETFAQGLHGMHSPLEYLMIALHCPDLSNKERNKIWSCLIDQWIQGHHQVTRSAIIFQDALKTLCERSQKSIKNTKKSPTIILSKQFRLRVWNTSVFCILKSRGPKNGS